MSLSASIKSIQDIMRKDVGVDGDAQRISQLVWLLFLKIFDAQEEEMEATRDYMKSGTLLRQVINKLNEGINFNRTEEFDIEKKWWGKPGQESKRKETEPAWRVSIADIAARGYNLDVKNPNVVDYAHRDPAELLAEYQKAQAAVAEVREKLRKELEAALMR